MQQLLNLQGNVILGSAINLSGSVIIGEKTLIEGNLIIGGGRIYPTYKEEYEVNPKYYTQTLETEDKVMVNDLTINAISYNEVTNEAGGLTAKIGEI